MKRKAPKFEQGDVVSFKFSNMYKVTYNGVIVGAWHRLDNRVIYEIASMNHGMCSYSIDENCVVKKISE